MTTTETDLRTRIARSLNSRRPLVAQRLPFADPPMPAPVPDDRGIVHCPDCGMETMRLRQHQGSWRCMERQLIGQRFDAPLAPLLPAAPALVGAPPPPPATPRAATRPLPSVAARPTRPPQRATPPAPRAKPLGRPRSRPHAPPAPAPAPDDVRPDILDGLFAQLGADYPLLTAAEEVELGRRVQAGDAAARDRLALCNVRLVVKEAQRRRAQAPRGWAVEDLVQEGMRGLMAAVTRFDPERGNRFSTLAIWWIRQAIGRAIHEGDPIRLPTHQAERRAKVGRAVAIHWQTHGRAPTPAELAEATGLAELAVARTLGAPVVAASLDEGRPGDDELTLGGSIPADVPDPAETAVAASLRADLVAALADHLTERQQRVLVLRFGLDGHGPRNLQEVGDALGLTRERARQIERDALEALRAADLAGLRAYLT